MKRAIPLLFAVAILFTLAPVAEASHCYGCKIRPEPNYEPPECVTRANYGYASCYEDYENDVCVLNYPCGPHAASVTPMAAEFEVASVERLDEPKTAASDTLVATVQAPQPTIR